MSHTTSELKIPTPYGKLAAKTWGEQTNATINILAIHGWQDNACTFDRLVPLLDLRNVYIVAIDLPGHGMSSHLPPGVAYNDITWVIEIKRIVDHLKWSKFSFLSHSMGAVASLQFANLFPEYVHMLISIDTIRPQVFGVDELAERTRQDINNFLKFEEVHKRMPEMIFSYDRAINALIVAHTPMGDITIEGAKCLIKRSAKIAKTKSGSNTGFVFSRDYRLQAILNRKTDQQSLLKYYSSINCELLIINGKDSVLASQDFRPFYDLYSKNCSKFRLVEERGDHYIHLTEPQLVAPHINQFLREARDKSE